MLRRLFTRIMVVPALILGVAVAQAQAPASAYQTLNPPQVGGVNGKIEVLEFFAFTCPHCRHFEPMLDKWSSAQTPDVVFKKIPISFGNPAVQPQIRLFYTLEAMGLAKKLTPAIFEAVQDKRVRFDKEDERNAWLTQQGVDVKKFNDIWRSSFAVDALTRRAEQLSAAYKIMGVPSMAINGKYVVEGGSPENLGTTDKLIAQERAILTKK